MKQILISFLLIFLLVSCISSESDSDDSFNDNIKLGFDDFSIRDSCFVMNAVGSMKMGVSGPDSTYYVKGTLSESLIRETMQEIDWEEFHLVWLEDQFNCNVEVAGSMSEDFFGSSYQRYRQSDGRFLCEMINTNFISGVDQLTQILVSYFNRTDDWHTKNNFE